MKRILRRTPMIVCLAAALTMMAAITIHAQRGLPAPASASEASEIQRGLAIAPVPLDLRGKNRALVARGSYIVNAQAVCTDCHTNPPYVEGGNPFLGQTEIANQAGYLAGGGEMFGPFVPRNLTPNRDGLPAGLSLSQFLHVINTGADLKGRAPFVPSPGHDLLQVMPWPVYRNMTERDLTAIYEYLRAIPCVGSVERCGS